jgi:hypothetical protein
MTVRIPTVLLVLAVAAILSACGGARGGSAYADLEPPRHAVSGVSGRTCHYVQQPVAPSNLDELTRPGTRGSILIWGRDATPSDTVEVSVRYGQDGRLAWTRAIRSNVAADRVAEVERLLLDGLFEEGPADWGVRVRLVGGGIDAVLPSVMCLAEQGPAISHPPRPTASREEMREATWQARVRQMEVDVGLDETGRITEVYMARTSGSRLLDQYIIDLVRLHRYHPKLHDGIGVPSTLPFRVRIPRF